MKTNISFFTKTTSRNITATASLCLLVSMASLAQRAKYDSSYATPDFEKLPSVKWKFHTNGPLLSSPVISADVVYFGGLDSILYAIDIQVVERFFRTVGVSLRVSAIFLAGHAGRHIANGLGLEAPRPHRQLPASGAECQVPKLGPGVDALHRHRR